MARTLQFRAPHVTVESFGGARHIYDANTGAKLAQVDVIRGFSHYYGVRGGAHEGCTAVVRGGVEALVEALAAGISNGRDDRS